MNSIPRYVSFLKENRTKKQAIKIYNQRIKDSSEVFKKYSSSFYKRSCPICGNTKTKKETKFNNQYNISRCKKCSSIFVNPAPSFEALNYYYNNCECNKLLANLYQKRSSKGGIILSERCKNVVEIIEKILHTKKSIRVIEVGCGSGSFLNELNHQLKIKKIQKNVDLFGIDIDQNAINNPVSKNLKIYHTSAEAFLSKTKKRFDLILHFELIEHLNDPFLFCKTLISLLNKNGLMYFHTPNILGLDNQSISYNEFRPLAHGIFPPMHLNAFTTQNISHFLLRTGFQIKNIETPGNFDVDIVKNFVDKKNHFSIIKKIKNVKDLAILQFVIRKLHASSHLAVLANK
jgi:2-polyprenyl-3-methyl-5-hydroxy-6-metoxy-1,4-benzoquinol methylase